MIQSKGKTPFKIKSRRAFSLRPYSCLGNALNYIYINSFATPPHFLGKWNPTDSITPHLNFRGSLGQDEPLTQNERNHWIRTEFLKYELPLVRFTTRFVGQEVAREIVQDSFLKLHCHKSPKEVMGSEKPWLYKVCRNKAIDYLRRKKTASAHFHETDSFSDYDLTLRIENKEAMSDILNSLDLLSSLEKEILILKFQEDLSYKEIGQIVGKTSNLVGVTLSKALSKIRETLNQKPRSKNG